MTTRVWRWGRYITKTNPFRMINQTEDVGDFETDPEVKVANPFILANTNSPWFGSTFRGRLPAHHLGSPYKRKGVACRDAALHSWVALAKQPFSSHPMCNKGFFTGNSPSLAVTFFFEKLRPAAPVGLWHCAPHCAEVVPPPGPVDWQQPRCTYRF